MLWGHIGLFLGKAFDVKFIELTFGNWVIQLPEVNTAKLPTPKLSVMVKFERLSGLW